MSGSSLIKKARENYKKAAGQSWLLGLTTGILIAAILALDLVVPGLMIVTFPFLIVPIVFSATLHHIMLRRGAPLTVFGSFKSFILYFTGTFFGSFSIITSFLKSVLCFIIIEFIVSMVASTLFQVLSPVFIESIKAFTALIEDAEATTADMMALLEINGGILNTYLIVVFVPSFLASVIFLLYLLSRNSITIYLRMKLNNNNPRFIKMIYQDVLRRKRFKMLGDYFMLNWPLYVLLILGFSSGAVLGYFWKQDLLTVITVALSMGALLSSFFLPFYFPNNEALYEKYDPDFHAGAAVIANMLVKNLQESIDLSIEEKKALEKSLSEANNPLEDKNDDDEDSDNEV